ncbi:MAG: hypothetical protein ACREDR_29520 [Blastocatellia bacterium]
MNAEALYLYFLHGIFAQEDSNPFFHNKVRYLPRFKETGMSLQQALHSSRTRFEPFFAYLSVWFRHWAAAESSSLHGDEVAATSTGPFAVRSRSFGGRRRPFVEKVFIFGRTYRYSKRWLLD